MVAVMAVVTMVEVEAEVEAEAVVVALVVEDLARSLLTILNRMQEDLPTVVVLDSLLIPLCQSLLSVT